MGIFDLLGGSKGQPVTSQPEVGVGRASIPGHFEAWAVWNPAAPLEVFRVTVIAEDTDRPAPAPITYTFQPAHDRPFSQPLEVPLAWKEFLVGVKPAKKGHLAFEFLLSGNERVRAVYELDDIIRL